MPEEQFRPKHIAIIMDGNNRWAKSKMLGGISGHKAGRDAVRTVVESCARNKIEVLTLFAFSSENWRRPKDEVAGLMELFQFALKREVKKLHKNNIRLRIIGDIAGFSDTIQALIKKSENLTASNTGMTLVVAANYGGQWDIAESCRRLAIKVSEGSLKPDQINEEMIAEGLSLHDLPDPDLCIRTAGEQRISNFLLWQFAYSEFYFTDVLWPDFGSEEIEKAIASFSTRIRRFGRTDDQISKMKERPCSQKD